MRFLLLGFLLFLSSALQCAQATPLAGAGQDWSNWVLRVEVRRADGKMETGSAVAIAPERVITNCHVVRNASKIRLWRKAESWAARTEIGDAYRDLCFLDVPGFHGAIPPLAGPGDDKVGVAVVAAGYSGGQLSARSGVIKGLYFCSCDGGQVIQTSASFDPGASGGGLFDGQGRLLGILTFKSMLGGDFHFAVPVGWMKMMTESLSDDIGGRGSFWENSHQESGYFLAACDMHAKQDWTTLLKLALDWSRQTPSDPQAWMALGRAQLGLHRQEAAVTAFQRVLQLDSTHAEAWWELQKLELDLGRTLTDGRH